jgi:predicted aspartyl protease
MLRVLSALALAGALVFGPTPAAAQPQVATKPSALAFEFVQERQILLPITVNGIPAEAWLDSGASATVLDAAFARRLGLTLHGRVHAQGVSGAVAGVRLTNVDLVAANLSFRHRQVAVMDLSTISKAVQRPVEVILGRDVFDAAVIELDFRSQTIVFLPQRSFQPPAEAPLHLRRSGALRSVPVVISGQPTEAVLDLGNAGGLLLDRQFVDSRGLLKGRRVSTQLSVGADGPRESILVSLDDVEVAGVTLDQVPAIAAMGLASHAPANLGLAVLSRFHLTIDFAHDRIWMRPYPDAATAPFRKNRSGLGMVPEEGRLRVTHVAAGSPAEVAGWRVGEMIVAIEGRPIGPDYIAGGLSRWNTAPAGQVVALQMVDGSTRRLTLDDYY